MKGILIDPFNETIKDIILSSDLSSKEKCSKEICTVCECKSFLIVYINGYFQNAFSGIKTILYVDKEGLNKKPQRYFNFRDTFIAGKGLLLRENDLGETISTTLTVEEIKDMVTWLPEDHTIEDWTETNAR